MSAYENGFSFYRDLLVTFGTAKARTMTNDYLTIQEEDDRRNGRFTTDPEEFLFCRELWQAMTADR